MLDIDPEFADLLARARTGCQEAARLLYERYSDGLRCVIRRHLSKRVQSVVDIDDVLQSIFKDLFADNLQKEIFATEQNFLAFLLRLAEHKVKKTHRTWLGTQKRSLEHQVPLSTELATPQATPEQAAAGKDEWQEWLSRLEPGLRQAFILLRAGATQREATAVAGLSERSLARMIQSARFPPAA